MGLLVRRARKGTEGKTNKMPVGWQTGLSSQGYISMLDSSFFFWLEGDSIWRSPSLVPLLKRKAVADFVVGFKLI